MYDFVDLPGIYSLNCFSFEEEVVTEEEIRMMVDVGQEKGTIEQNEKEMMIPKLENIIDLYDVV